MTAPRVARRCGCGMSQLAQVPDDHPAWDAAAHYVAGMRQLVMVASPQRIVLGGVAASRTLVAKIREGLRAHRPVRAARLRGEGERAEAVPGGVQARERGGDRRALALAATPPAGGGARRRPPAADVFSAWHYFGFGWSATRRAQDCNGVRVADGGSCDGTRREDGKERRQRRSRFLSNRSRASCKWTNSQRPAALRLPETSLAVTSRNTRCHRQCLFRRSQL